MSITVTGKKNIKKNTGNGKLPTGSIKFDEMRLRLFEPKREKREYNLETDVINLVDDYMLFLSEKNDGLKPSPNGVIETLAINALKQHTEFQNWREKKLINRSETNNAAKQTDADDDDETILDNLTDKTKSANPQN